MFQFPALFSLSGFSFEKVSNSEILGSMFACNSPKLIAACHVLLHNSSQAILLTAWNSYNIFLTDELPRTVFIEHDVLQLLPQKILRDSYVVCYFLEAFLASSSLKRWVWFVMFCDFFVDERMDPSIKFCISWKYFIFSFLFTRSEIFGIAFLNCPCVISFHGSFKGFYSSIPYGPVGNRTRDSSVQGRHFTTRLQALVILFGACSFPLAPDWLWLGLEQLFSLYTKFIWMMNSNL